MECIYCDFQLPDKGFFCPNCAKQTKCKHCSEALIKDAKLCVFCGEEIGSKTSVLNINTIEFSETESGRTFKASFTDAVGQSISDTFGIVIANRVSQKRVVSLPPNGSTDNISEHSTLDAELIDESAENLPELDSLKKIFKTEGEKTTLLETRLKAKSKRDYGIRLAIIFLYYKSLLGNDNVPRKNLTAIMENASVEDGNFRSWLAKNPLIGINGDQVEIKAPGKDAAKKFLSEILDTKLKDQWQIGTHSKAGRKSKDKKAAQKTK